MNTDKDVIAHLKEIIKIKDERIEGLNKSIDILSKTMELVDNKPVAAVKKAREYLKMIIPKTRQKNKEVLKDIQKILEYE